MEAGFTFKKLILAVKEGSIKKRFQSLHMKTFHMLRKRKEKQDQYCGRWIDLHYLLVGLAHIGSLVFAFHLGLFFNLVFDLRLFSAGFFNLVSWHDLNSQ